MGAVNGGRGLPSQMKYIIVHIVPTMSFTIYLKNSVTAFSDSRYIHYRCKKLVIVA